MKKYSVLFIFGLAFLVTVIPSWLGWYGDYTQLVLTYIGINIILVVSLNLVNGYMGEFSCGHAGFMAVGAYSASVLTVILFVDTPNFGAAWLSPGLATIIAFPLALLFGALVGALVGLLVAVPSFRTRGDYLAIITLAVNYIIKSLIENLEIVGGPRGFYGMANVVSGMNEFFPFPWILLWTLVGAAVTIMVVRNFIASTLGKSIVAIRDDEIAASLMSINTRRAKVTAFMLSSGLAGIGGGLFAHQLTYINPGNFTILKSVEVMVMVYLGGMGSLSGSILSAIFFTVLLEVLRPLGLFKWVLIPLLLILLMMFRPKGFLGDKELYDIFPALRKFWQSPEEVTSYALTSDQTVEPQVWRATGR